LFGNLSSGDHSPLFRPFYSIFSQCSVDKKAFAFHLAAMQCSHPKARRSRCATLVLGFSFRLFLAVLKRWLGCYFNLPIDIACLPDFALCGVAGVLGLLLPLSLRGWGCSIVSVFSSHAKPELKPIPFYAETRGSATSSTRLGLNYA